MVLSWRNNENIKKWMHNQDEITLDNHLKFIDDLESNTNKQYFLLKKDDDYIGVVSLIDNYLGIYANPQKKRVGDILLQTINSLCF